MDDTRDDRPIRKHVCDIKPCAHTIAEDDASDPSGIELNETLLIEKLKNVCTRERASALEQMLDEIWESERGGKAKQKLYEGVVMMLQDDLEGAKTLFGKLSEQVAGCSLPSHH